jgi:O-methyltransferase
MMVSPVQHRTIRDLLAEAIACHPGDVVEAGCNAGSTSSLLAIWLSHTSRQLHLYDSFEGLPTSSGFGGQMTAKQETLEAAICKALDVDVVPSLVQIHPGWFRRTMPDELPEEIAFAFVDCDVFDSLADSIPAIMDRLTGTIVVHDYTHPRWGSGVRRAVDSLLSSIKVVNGMAVLRKQKC